MNRKSFVRSTALAALGSTLIMSGCKPDMASSIEVIDTSKKYKWKMVTTWPPNFPVLGEACQMFADWVENCL